MSLPKVVFLDRAPFPITFKSRALSFLIIGWSMH